MSGYRFCRTDDIGLLVDALNRCWGPYFPDEPAATPASFKRSIRDLQVWCSSCMVAFSDGQPIAVLIGAKRSGGTLIQKLAVHPDHRRQGHGRHLLASLGSKLAILGPPRIVSEVPEAWTAARALFEACGYVEEAALVDYVSNGAPAVAAGGRLVIPVTVDDLDANGLLEDGEPACWERSADTLKARKDEIAGLAVASEEQLEACILYLRDGEILRFRSLIDDGGERLTLLLARLRAGGADGVRMRKVHAAEESAKWLETLGFIPAEQYRVFAGLARGD